jgi:hypothetical protein
MIIITTQYLNAQYKVTQLKPRDEVAISIKGIAI